jgi:hypothetical protein
LVSDRSWPASVAVLTVLAALAAERAAAQDFSAGKTAAQLFQSDCTACHKTPAGLAKGADARSLATFLKEHYTTKEESAVALAGYLASGAGGGQRPQVPTAAAPPNGPKPKTAARGGESEPEARQEPKSEPRSEPRSAPKPRANAAVEPPRQPEGEGAITREDPAKRLGRTPPAREDTRVEPAKGDGDAVVGKLRLYGAAGSDVKTIERSADQSKKLESHANSDAAGEATPPAEAGATNAIAAPPVDDVNAGPKRKPAERKKKDAAVTPPATAPAPHTARPHRPVVSQPPPGNN